MYCLLSFLLTTVFGIAGWMVHLVVLCGREHTSWPEQQQKGWLKETQYFQRALKWHTESSVGFSARTGTIWAFGSYIYLWVYRIAYCISLAIVCMFILKPLCLKYKQSYSSRNVLMSWCISHAQRFCVSKREKEGMYIYKYRERFSNWPSHDGESQGVNSLWLSQGSSHKTAFTFYKNLPLLLHLSSLSTSRVQ